MITTKHSRHIHLNDYASFICALMFLTVVIASFDKRFVTIKDSWDYTHLRFEILPSINTFYWYVSRILYHSHIFGFTYSLDYSKPQAFVAKTTKKMIMAVIDTNNYIFKMHWCDIPNFHVHLYPVDQFLEELYRRFYNEHRIDAFNTNKRVNPTLSLRLKQLVKYFVPISLPAESQKKLKNAFDVLFTQITTHPEFPKTAFAIRTSCDNRAFDDLVIDGSSAAGYPYPSGTKKRDVRTEAEAKASEMLWDNARLQAYLKDHVWYTTGRAKMLLRDSIDSARLVCYNGYAVVLIVMLYYQTFFPFVQKNFPQFGVGFSWAHQGARKVAKHIGDIKGRSPKGSKYISVDASGWDTSIHELILFMVLEFHLKIMKFCFVSERYITVFEMIFNDFVSPWLLFPMKICIRIFRGIKSGWPGTADENTLIHWAIVMCVAIDLGISNTIVYILYGDDNLMRVPEHITEKQIVDAYSKYGITIKVIHSSVHLKEVDFLSKHIVYLGNNAEGEDEYCFFRPTVETVSRLLMPETYTKHVPKEVVACEKLLGHLLDNPFNPVVWDQCTKLLTHIRDNFDIQEIHITPEMLKRAPYRFINPSRLKGILPTVPTKRFVMELYGVTMHDLSISWPSINTDFANINYKVGAKNMDFFDSANVYKKACHSLFSNLSKRNAKRVKWASSPYFSLKGTGTFGFHAARFEHAYKHFGLTSKKFLDFGSHPGAVAHSMITLPNASVTCVSLIPGKDKYAFPYVNAYTDKIKFHVCDVDQYVVDTQYDLIHDDVDMVGNRDEHVNNRQAAECLKRFIKWQHFTKHSMMTLHDVGPHVIELLYETYKVYGSFNIMKSSFSNPWRPEFVVLFSNSSTPIMKKGKFLQSLYSFFNGFSSEMIKWNDALMRNIHLVEEGKDPVRCPLQLDEDHIKRVKSYLFFS